jgi:hypothetical protein
VALIIVLSCLYVVSRAVLQAPQRDADHGGTATLVQENLEVGEAAAQGRASTYKDLRN